MVQSTGSLVDCWGFIKYLKIEVQIESQSGLYLPHEAVEETRSEGDGCDWQYLVVVVGHVVLPLSVLSITLKHNKTRCQKLERYSN